MRRAELVLTVAALAGELRDETSVLVVLDRARIDVPVGDEDVALARPMSRRSAVQTGISG